MKRGSSGLSLVVGIDKPAGVTSHDVVNRVRRIFEEKRVGHAGTLDPLASGVLPVLVGPATRLSDHLMGHDKAYRVRIAFGQGTTTDDAEGEVIRCHATPSNLLDKDFARKFLKSIIGPQNQLPPSYSAIKVNGKKAYKEARAGNIIDLNPRAIEIYSAELINIDGDGFPDRVLWDVDLEVSKGTYIRSIARDMGFTLDCPAHVASLRRTSVGELDVADCVSLETLEDVGAKATLDPVRLLGHSFAFIDGDDRNKLMNGCSFPLKSVRYHRYKNPKHNICACTSGIVDTNAPVDDGVAVSMICDNTLKAIYSSDIRCGLLRPQTIFSIGVERGQVI